MLLWGKLSHFLEAAKWELRVLAFVAGDTQLWVRGRLQKGFPCIFFPWNTETDFWLQSRKNKVPVREHLVVDSCADLNRLLNMSPESRFAWVVAASYVPSAFPVSVKITPGFPVALPCNDLVLLIYIYRGRGLYTSESRCLERLEETVHLLEL